MAVRVRHSLIKQTQDRFQKMCSFGRSKHADKLNGGIKEHIYSYDTYRTYLKQSCQFVKYCREKHHCHTLKECRQYVPEYMEQRSGLSAWTQQLDIAALNKLFGTSGAELGYKAPARHRQQIIRSREGAARDKNFNENLEYNSVIARFARSTGLRRAELSRVRGEQLFEENGTYYLRLDQHTGTKGGRERVAPVCGPDKEVALVVSLMQKAGEARVFERVPDAMDVHACRAEYAVRVYMAHRRPIEELTEVRLSLDGRHFKTQVYVCRGDMAGKVFDRKAMMIASRALGHNRLDVIAGHYLYSIPDTP